MAQSQVVLRFTEADTEDIGHIGTEALRLAELAHAGLPLPDGFIIPSTAYYRFFRESALTTKITHLLKTVNFDDPNSLLQSAAHIRKIIIGAVFPEDVQRDIVSAYRLLGGVLKDPLVLLSLSPLLAAHDMPYPLQEATLQHIQGEAALLLGIKTLWASQFEARALLARHQKRREQFGTGCAVIVRKRIAATVSGSITGHDRTTQTEATYSIEAVFGEPEFLTHALGEPDRYILKKADLSLLRKTLAPQTLRLEYVRGELHQIPVDKKQQHAPKLTDEDLRKLGQMAQIGEKLFYFPQRMRWAKAGKQLYLLSVTDYHGGAEEQKATRQPITTGTQGVGHIASGPVRIISHKKDFPSITPGDIVVTETVTDALIPALKNAGGLVTEKKPERSMTQSLFRKLPIPLVTGVTNARKLLRPAVVVTVDGKKGAVYHGGALSATPFTERRIHRGTVTKLYTAHHDAKHPEALPVADGSFLHGGSLIESLGVHPKKMLRDGKGAVYSRMLGEQIAGMSLGYMPRPVIYCASDLTSAAYRDLEGGKAFEVSETDPLLGYHGAVRAVHDPEVFALETAAVSYARNSLQSKNLWFMLPSARTPVELFQVKKLLTAAGLYRSPTFQVWFQLSIPSNVVRLKEFLKVGLDGVMLDAERLSMLFLGTAATDPEVSHLLHEEDESLLQAYRHCITICNEMEVSSVFSGRLPSSVLLKHLVSWGVSGLALTPHTLENARQTIYNYERQLVAA